MTREEAIKKIKEAMPTMWKDTKEAIQTVIPELRESDDEKIREEMIRYFTEMKKGGSASLPYDDCIAYLERQKEQKPADEAEKFFDSAESYNQGFVAGQKKMKEDIEKGFGISEHSLDYLAGRYAGYAAARQEQKPAEKQNYANLTDLERTIHRGFLAAGVDNVPVEIIKETAKECLTQMKPSEWSKEDKQCFDEAIEALESLDFNGEASNLKSLRDCRKPLNTWKPSEEQMEAMKNIAYGMYQNGDGPILRELYEQLEKLM